MASFTSQFFISFCHQNNAYGADAHVSHACAEYKKREQYVGVEVEHCRDYFVVSATILIGNFTIFDRREACAFESVSSLL